MSLGGPGAPVGSCGNTADPMHAAICASIAAAGAAPACTSGEGDDRYGGTLYAGGDLLRVTLTRP